MRENCNCQICQIDKDSTPSFRPKWAGKYEPRIPETMYDFQEIATQMLINADIIKSEVTKHIDDELKRFQEEIEKVKKK